MYLTVSRLYHLRRRCTIRLSAKDICCILGFLDAGEYGEFPVDRSVGLDRDFHLIAG